MTLSAVAVRLAAAAQQQKLQQTSGTMIKVSSSVCVSPTPSSSETIDNSESRQDDEIQTMECDEPVPFAAQAHRSTGQELPQTNSTTSNPTREASTNHLTPPKYFKRSRETLRSGFIDHECVSNWEPVNEGPHQNIFQTVDPNHHQSKIWTLGLQTGQTLVCHGTLQLTIFCGAVQLMGSELSPSSSQPIHLFAPPSHPLPIITAKDTQSRGDVIQVPHLDPSQFSSIVQLRDYHCGLHQLDQLWSSNGSKLPIWNRSSRPHPIQGQTWSLLLSCTPDLAHLQVPPSWSTSLSNLSTTESNGIYVVEGPKGAGKSTFSTLLINSLLNTFKTVALLDLDPGQPLLTPPTLLSLHMLNSPILGPPFCRLVSPHHSDSHSIYIGHTTPKDCPNQYVEASLQLFNVYLNTQPDSIACASRNKRRRQRDAQLTDSIDMKRIDQVPLVINTMGWTRGPGRELLNQVCESIQPSKIFSFSDHLVITSLSEAAKRHISLEPIGPTPLSLRLTPADCRVLTLVSYMHSSPASGGEFFVDQWDFQHPLWTRRPFEVRPELINLPDHPDFNRNHLGHLLNGGLIGFINSTSGWWIGFGLVRAIEPTKKALHLLTPAYPTSDQNPTDFEFVKCSEPEVPVICCISDGIVPYLEKGILGGSSSNPTTTHGNSSNLTTRLGKKRVRRNVQRRSQVVR